MLVPMWEILEPGRKLQELTDQIMDEIIESYPGTSKRMLETLKKAGWVWDPDANKMVQPPEEK